MAAVTLNSLIARARQRADMPVAGFVADDANGIYAWINEGVQKLQELLVKAYGEEFVETSTTFNTVAGTTDYNLPTDMLAFYGIDMTVGGLERCGVVWPAGVCPRAIRGANADSPAAPTT